MDGANMPHRSPLHGRQGDHACATLNLVVPLAHEATDMRATDTTDGVQVRSGAVFALIGASLRRGDVDSTNGRSTQNKCIEYAPFHSVVVYNPVVRCKPVVAKQELYDGKSEGQYQAWAARHIDLHALEVDDAALQQSERKQLPVLRRAGRGSLRALARFSIIPFGYGRLPRFIADTRQDREFTRVRAGELPLGHSGRAEQESTGPCGDAYLQRHDTKRCAMGRGPWHEGQQHQYAAAPWLDCRKGADDTHHEARQTASAVTRTNTRATLGARLNPTKTILQPVDRGVDFVGHVIKPWCCRVRRRTMREAVSRIGAMDAADVFTSANSYFGLLRQSTHSHADRARLARAVLNRGHVVNKNFTKTYRKPL